MSAADELDERTRRGIRAIAEWADEMLTIYSQRVGAEATRNWMRDSGPVPGTPNRLIGPGTLRMQSGRLARSLRGFGGATGNPEGIERIRQVGAFVFELSKGTRVPYAGLQEEGGSITVTPRMRRFFWAQFMETRQEMWRNMAISRKDRFRFPARPFLRPAARAALPEIQRLGKERLVEILRPMLE